MDWNWSSVSGRGQTKPREPSSCPERDLPPWSAPTKLTTYCIPVMKVCSARVIRMWTRMYEGITDASRTEVSPSAIGTKIRSMSSCSRCTSIACGGEAGGSEEGGRGSRRRASPPGRESARRCARSRWPSAACTTGAPHRGAPARGADAARRTDLTSRLPAAAQAARATRLGLDGREAGGHLAPRLLEPLDELRLAARHPQPEHAQLSLEVGDRHVCNRRQLRPRLLHAGLTLRGDRRRVLLLVLLLVPLDRGEIDAERGTRRAGAEQHRRRRPQDSLPRREAGEQRGGQWKQEQQRKERASVAHRSW